MGAIIDRASIVAAAFVLVFVLGSESGASEEPEIARWAEAIDAAIDAKCDVAGVPCAPPASDAEFLRRASRDLIGRIPTSFEARAFLSDANPDKRDRVVADLVKRPTHSLHLARVWSDVWLAQAEVAGREALKADFEEWLHSRIRARTPYDELVAELMLADFRPRPAMQMRSGADQIGVSDSAQPVAYFQLHDQQPASLAASVARSFLGISIECAQCHDHPFGSWERDEFWSLAAFFSDLRLTPGLAAAPTIAIPETELTVSARFPYDDEGWTEGTSSRGALAGWMTEAENAYFARNAANRVWASMFGRGLVEPLDDAAEAGSGNREALDVLTKSFVEGDFDVTRLMRTIAATDAYQRSSRETHEGQSDPELFARSFVRGLTAEQSLASLATATGMSLNDAEREEFLKLFAAAATPIRRETTILQSLTMMNGSFVAIVSDPERSTFLRALRSPLLDDDDRIDALYLSTLSRLPSDSERADAQSYLDELPANERFRGYGDLLWAILNSHEFRLNS